MYSEFTITTIGDQILAVNDDGEEKTGYLVHDLSTLRGLVDTYLEKEDDKARIMKAGLASKMPENSTKKAVIFSKTGLEIWEILLGRTNKALNIQDPLPRIPSGQVCIAIGDGNKCLVIGFCDLHGKHLILVIESLAGFHAAMQKELAWLAGIEREFYVAMSEKAFAPIDGLPNTKYIVIEGEFCECLNTGSSWLDSFETMITRQKAENEIEGYFNFPITPEG